MWEFKFIGHEIFMLEIVDIWTSVKIYFFAKFWKCMMCANIKDVYIVWPKTKQRINKSLQILLFEKLL